MYGTLVVALVLYGFGLYAICSFIGPWRCQPVFEVAAGVVKHMACATTSPNDWHIVVATLVALFSVPTILVISVFRAASRQNGGSNPESPQSLLTEKLVDLVQAIVDRLSGSKAG